MLHFHQQSPTLFEGSGGRIQLLPDGITYLRIDHDGEVSALLTHEILVCMHALCDEQRPLVLIDRHRTYWLSFEAQRVLMEHTGLAAVAYWIQRPMSAEMADHAKSTYFEHLPVRVFMRREDAVRWLASFQPTAPKMVPLSYSSA